MIPALVAPGGHRDQSKATGRQGGT